MKKYFPERPASSLFFVLSGFLLTRQMIVEIETSGTLRIGGFYLRRILRLLPALSCYIAVFTPALLYLGTNITRIHILSGLLYFANYYHIFTGYPPYNPMPILWSLSVEEHFYILFPFLMLTFRSNLRASLPVMGLLLIATLAWRLALYHICQNHTVPICGLPGRIRTQGTDAIFDCILYGCVAALMLHYYNESTRRIFINPIAFTLAGFILLVSFAIRTPDFRETLRYSVQSACVCIIMMNVLFGEADLFKRILEDTRILTIGKLSYSLYLMHFGVLIAIEATHETDHLRNSSDMLLYFTLSFMLAVCSYLLVEQPMAVIRRKIRKK